MDSEWRPDELDRLVRSLAPKALAALLRRGEDFATAEDAVQDAILAALRAWPEQSPRDPQAWLTAVAQRRLVDTRRGESARRRRESSVAVEPGQGPTELGDDTLLLLFWCCHPELSPASQIALRLRAVGGLTTREIADAFFVPEATMAQRIVLRVLSLVYHAGHGRRPDLAGEAIRLTRQLTLATSEPEARGLLALLLLQHARLPARNDEDGRFVPLDEQDRSLWNTAEIGEGVDILQCALAEERPGRYQMLAAIAALHADALTSADTDWPQILEWYDDLVALSADLDPAAVLNRAVAVGHVAGAAQGLAETDRAQAALGDQQQWFAVRAYLYGMAGDFREAGNAYAAAAARTTHVAERDHLVRRAARARARL